MSQVRDSAIKLFGADITHIPIKPTTRFTDLHSLSQIQPLPQPIIIMVMPFNPSSLLSFIFHLVLSSSFSRAALFL